MCIVDKFNEDIEKKINKVQKIIKKFTTMHSNFNVPPLALTICLSLSTT